MRQLGEQWIEIIDGQKHMVKAVKPVELCQGCCFNCNQGGCCWKGFDDCQMGSFFIIKDLGPVNEDGCLPMPCDSNVYPEVSVLIGDVWQAKAQSRTVFMEARGRGKQKCIDAWNRRN